VTRTSADRAEQDGSGIAGLVETIGAHQSHLDDSGERQRRRSAAAAREIEAVVLAELRARFGHAAPGGPLSTLAEQVAAGALGPYAAADRLLAQLPAQAHGSDRPPT
jgi:LAO/AO transport system kinase